MSVSIKSCGVHWATQEAYVVPRRREDVVEEVLDGEAILFDPVSGNMHRLNETAVEVWRQCDGRCTTHQIAEEQAKIYEVPFEAAVDHVEQVVSALGQLQLFCQSDET